MKTRPKYISKPPTVQGLYWYRVGPSKVDRHCRVWRQNGKLITQGGDGIPKDVRLFMRSWAGPLLRPR